MEGGRTVEGKGREEDVDGAGKRLDKSRGRGGEGGTGGREAGRDKTELPPRRLGDDLGGSEFILNLVGLRSAGREALSPP